MAIFRGSMIRGTQIKDRTVEGAQILQEALRDEHIASNAAINETKLNIDWHAHKEALTDRKLVDFVQVNGLQVSGTSIDLEEQVATLVGVPSTQSNSTTEGVIIDAPKNLVPMRDAVTGEPLVTETNPGVEYEVLARIEKPADKYVLSFYTASGVDGAEVPFDLGTTEVTVDIQYARRFNLATIDEMFAANEKFVHGATDITSYLNIEQLAKDLYGSTWSVDRDGDANLAISLADQIKNETAARIAGQNGGNAALDAEIAARTSADTTLQNNITSEANARIAADTQLTADLAKEVTDRTNADTALQNALNAEVTNRTSADDALQTALTAEVNRAKAAETVLTDDLAAEVTRAKAAETTLQGNIDAEVQARLTAEAAINASITAETNARMAADAALTSNLAAEVTRATDAEAALQNAIDAEKTRAQGAEQVLTNGLAQEIADRTAADKAIVDKLASNTIGSGAATIGISTIPGFAATTVQGAIEELKTSAGDSLVQFKADLASQVAGLGASLVAVTAGKGFTGETVEAVLENHESRLDVIEANVLASGSREASANNYFSAQTFATINERFDSDEVVVDANLARIDARDLFDRTRVASVNGFFSAEVKATLAARFVDIETELDAKAKEIVTARGTAASLNERLSVALRADGHLVDDVKIHTHRKYTVTIATNQSTVSLPAGEAFNLSGAGTVTVNAPSVYINGILQANGINFTEIVSGTDATKGVGVDFTPEELFPGDVVVIEWVVNNAN